MRIDNRNPVIKMEGESRRLIAVSTGILVETLREIYFTCNLPFFKFL